MLPIISAITAHIVAAAHIVAGVQNFAKPCFALSHVPHVSLPIFHLAGDNTCRDIRIRLQILLRCTNCLQLPCYEADNDDDEDDDNDGDDVVINLYSAETMQINSTTL